jgi:hypothetical protein
MGVTTSGATVTGTDVGVTSAGGTDTGVDVASIVEVGTEVGEGIAVGSGWEHETIPAINKANTAMPRLFLMVAAPLTGLPSAIYRPLFSIGAKA